MPAATRLTILTGAVPLSAAPARVGAEFGLPPGEVVEPLASAIRAGAVLIQAHGQDGSLRELSPEFLRGAEIDVLAGTIGVPVPRFVFLGADEAPGCQRPFADTEKRQDQAPSETFWLNLYSAVAALRPWLGGQSAVRRSRVGRRPDYDWSAIEVEIALQIGAFGIPKPRAALVKRVAAWCVRTFGKEPDGRALDRRCLALITRFQQLLEGAAK